jgi:hypothetical protein
MSVFRHFGGSCYLPSRNSLTHARSAASVAVAVVVDCAHLQVSGPWEKRYVLSMNNLRGDLSAPLAFDQFQQCQQCQQFDLAKRRCRCWCRRRFLQQNRSRPSASLRITFKTLISRYTPLSRAIAASPPPPPPPPQLPPRPLALRHSSLLAVEAPLKRRRKQDLLLPTSPRRPP